MSNRGHVQVCIRLIVSTVMVAVVILLNGGLAAAAMALDFTDTGATPTVSGATGSGTILDPLLVPANSTFTLEVWVRQTAVPIDSSEHFDLNADLIGLTSFGVSGALAGGTAAFSGNTSATFFSNTASQLGADTLINEPGHTPPVTAGFGVSSAAFTAHGNTFSPPGAKQAAPTTGGIRLGDITVSVGASGTSTFSLTDSSVTHDDWGFGGLTDDAILQPRTLTLQVAAIPEPSGFLFLGIVGAPLLALSELRRRYGRRTA